MGTDEIQFWIWEKKAIKKCVLRMFGLWIIIILLLFFFNCAYLGKVFFQQVNNWY